MKMTITIMMALLVASGAFAAPGDELPQQPTAEDLAREEAAVKAAPKDFNARHRLAVVLMRRGVYDRALSMLQELRAEQPQNPDVLLDIGIAYGAQRQHQEAIKWHKQATQAAPKYDMAWFMLGVSHKLAGEREAALTALKKVTEINPKMALAYAHQGRLLGELQRFDEAETAFRKVVELEPEFAEGWNGLAQVLDAKGENDEALAAYRKALEINPESREARYYFAALSARVGDQETAEKQLKILMEKDREWGETLEIVVRKYRNNPPQSVAPQQ